jgi:hypothetical protein
MARGSFPALCSRGERKTGMTLQNNRAFIGNIRCTLDLDFSEEDLNHQGKYVHYEIVYPVISWYSRYVTHCDSAQIRPEVFTSLRKL